jgi:hypothetical protein
VHQAPADRADRAKISRPRPEGDKFRHSPGRLPRLPTLDAIAFGGAALFARRLPRGQKLHEVFAENERGLPIRKDRQPSLNPTPHGPFGDAEQSGHFINRVATNLARWPDGLRRPATRADEEIASLKGAFIWRFRRGAP